MSIDRRSFLKGIGATAFAMSEIASHAILEAATFQNGKFPPGRIPNYYSLLLPGEEKSLTSLPQVVNITDSDVVVTISGFGRNIKPGTTVDGWHYITNVNRSGLILAVFEKHVTYQGKIVYLDRQGNQIAAIPKGVGKLSAICPRPINPSGDHEFERAPQFKKGPDIFGNTILNSGEDPCYENVAALGKEYIGWTLVSNEECGPEYSLFLDADGKSRELYNSSNNESAWAPDSVGNVINPMDNAPGNNPELYETVAGFSKRTLLGGYLPVADTGIYNTKFKSGYETIVIMPFGINPTPIARVRYLVPSEIAASYPPNNSLYQDTDGSYFLDYYQNCTPQQFHNVQLDIWLHWSSFFSNSMQVDIPDTWLLNAARAGITLSRASYQGFKPTYQIGEGAYTKIPQRSHALFPVAHYEFIWAQQLWGLVAESDPYFQYYLDNYILPDGNFLYNTQDQVEAPLDGAIVLTNSVRGYRYTRDLTTFEKRLPVLTRMLNFLLERYQYSKQTFPETDRRYGLIWGSPEADWGNPNNDTPTSHPYYFQNAVWTWRGIYEHANCLREIAKEHKNLDYATQSEKLLEIANEMHGCISRSLTATLEAFNPAMKAAKISPFWTDDINRDPTDLNSYENHRFMMDWFTADWGVPELDNGHLIHRNIAGMQLMGLGTDGDVSRVSNFMEHGTLAVRIRQDDYRPFLLALYSLACYTADSGNRYSPEDAYMPGGMPGEGNPYFWSSVVNSVLQPTMGLRWLLCYEENNKDVIHLQKAAPDSWFLPGKVIKVDNCPTRFGNISWSTHADSSRLYKVNVLFSSSSLGAELVIHLHPPKRKKIHSSSIGKVEGNSVTFTKSQLANRNSLAFEVQIL